MNRHVFWLFCLLQCQIQVRRFQVYIQFTVYTNSTVLVLFRVQVSHSHQNTPCLNSASNLHKKSMYESKHLDIVFLLQVILSF